MTMHAKPCFYCIVLISSLCVSSCYWQPFSIDTPLAAPWEQNVTTYREALISQIPSIHSWRTNEIPDAIRPVDRCWCDLSGSSIFDRFNVSRWEYNTVYKLKQDLVKGWDMEEKAEDMKRRQENEDKKAQEEQDVADKKWSLKMPSLSSPKPKKNPKTAPVSSTTASDPWRTAMPTPYLGNLLSKFRFSSHPSPDVQIPEPEAQPPRAAQRQPGIDATHAMPAQPTRTVDLKQYGVNMVVDFGWS